MPAELPAPGRGTLATVSFAAAGSLCCAGSAVLVAGFVSGLGGLLRIPGLIGGGTAMIVAAVRYSITRDTRGRSATAAAEHRS